MIHTNLKVKVLGFIMLLLSFGVCNAQKSVMATPSKFIAYSLYNFSKLFSWPNEAVNNTFKITVVGDKLVYDELMQLAQNKKVGYAAYQITYCKTVNELKGVSQIVYLSNMQSGKVRDLASMPGSKGVLFVTEREKMTQQGSVISFLTDSSGKMGFEVSRENASKNNLIIRPQLEKLAYRII
ncbi:MAG: YfiR family protein [Bacteroidales bacterium]|nr:YfiR family protein [Bacteroidales bacterium]